MERLVGGGIGGAAGPAGFGVSLGSVAQGGAGLVPGTAVALSPVVGGLEPPGVPAASAGLTLAPGMTMAEIEKAAILGALRQTRGNRRKAAELLDIGERTMYRKLKEYQVPEEYQG